MSLSLLMSLSPNQYQDVHEQMIDRVKNQIIFLTLSFAAAPLFTLCLNILLGLSRNRPSGQLVTMKRAGTAP